MPNQTTLQKFMQRNRKATTGSTLSSKIANAKTRLSDVGATKDTRNWLEKKLNLKEDQNALFDILEIIGRPQQAIFGAIKAGQEGYDVGASALEGLKGEDYTYGGDVLRNAGMKDSGDKIGADDITGFALDLALDPLNVAAPVKVASEAGKATKWVSGYDAIAGLTGKTIKETAKLTDKALSAGLKANDARMGINYTNDIRNITKENQAIKGGYESYKNLKGELGQIFNYRKTVPAGLADTVAKTDAQVEAATNIMKTRLNQYAKDIEDFSKKTGRDSKAVSEDIQLLHDTSRIPIETIPSMFKKKTYFDVVPEERQNLFKVLNDNKIEYTINKDTNKIKITKIPKEVKVNRELVNQLDNFKVSLNKNINEKVVNRLENIKKDKQLLDFYNTHNPNEVMNDFTRIGKEIGQVDLKTTENYVRRQLDISKRPNKNKGFVARKTDTTSDIASENIRYKERNEVSRANLDKEIENNVKNLSEYKINKTNEQIEELKNKINDKQSRISKSLGKRGAETKKLYKKLIDKEVKRVSISDIFSTKIFKKFEKLTPGKDLDYMISYAESIGKKEKEYALLFKKLDNEKLTNSQFDRLINELGQKQIKLNEMNSKMETLIQQMDTKVVNTMIDTIDKSNKYADSVAKNSNEYMRIKDKLKSYKESTKIINKTMRDSLARTEAQLEYLTNKLDFIKNDPDVLLKDKAIKDKITELTKQKKLLSDKSTEKLFTESMLESMAGFIETAEVEMKAKRALNEILISDTFNNPELFRLVSKNTSETVPGMVKVDSSSLIKIYDTWGDVVTDKSIIDNLKMRIKGQDVYMNPMIHTMLFRRVNQQDAKTLLSLVNTANNMFKKFKTFSPGFHMRNNVGNPVNMWLTGVPAVQIPIYQSKSVKSWKKINGLLDKLSIGAKLTDEEKKTYELFKEFADEGLFKVSSKVQDLDEIIKASKNGKTMPKKAYDWLFQMNAELNSRADGMNRLALFMYAKEHPKYVSNLGLKSAGEATRLTLFDPSDLSPFEQDVLKKVIPFYTFTKQNLILQIKNIEKNPAKYVRIAKANKAVWDGQFDEDEYMDWQKQGFNLPLPINDSNDNPIMLKLNLPLSDLGEYMSDPLKRGLSSLTPVVRAPFEAVTGKEIFTGRDIDLSTSKGKIDFIAKNTGLDLFTKSGDKISQVKAMENPNAIDWALTLAPSVASTVDTEKNITNNQYTELEELQAYIKQLKDAGVAVRDINEIRETAKQRLARLQRQRKKNSTY